MLDTAPAVEQALARGDDGPAGGDWHELVARTAWLDTEQAAVLHLWYADGRSPGAIADSLGRSVRHVYRVRAAAVDRLAAFGRPTDFLDADVAEFV